MSIIYGNSQGSEGTRKRLRIILGTGIVLVICILTVIAIQRFPETEPPPKNDGQNNVSSQKTGQVSSKPEQAKPPQANSWQLTLVNKSHAMQQNYSPAVTEVGNGYLFDSRAAEQLKSMLRDAKKAGLSPIICSAYRNLQKQTSLYQEQVNKWKVQGLSEKEAQEKAKTVVAYPGTSEHTLGLAADIVSEEYQLLDDHQAQTPEAKWLKANCSKYGFILRYPPEKSSLTGVIFEPWHFRYVGKEAATEIMSKGICLEEYLNETA